MNTLLKYFIYELQLFIYTWKKAAKRKLENLKLLQDLIIFKHFNRQNLYYVCCNNYGYIFFVTSFIHLNYRRVYILWIRAGKSHKKPATYCMEIHIVFFLMITALICAVSEAVSLYFLRNDQQIVIIKILRRIRNGNNFDKTRKRII